MSIQVLIFGLVQLCLISDVVFAMTKARSNFEVRDVRIIGGQVMSPHSIQFIAYISLLDSRNLNFACGGSLISMRHVLTAAHCLLRMRVEYVLLGAHNISAAEPEQMKLYPENWAAHEKYNSRKDLNDIGMIKLFQDIIPNLYIDIIKLEDASDASESYEGEYSAAYGWGLIRDKPWRIASDVLWGVQLDIISNSKCRSLAQETSIHEGDLCTSGINEVGTCYGDSGGPLILNGKQIGITSRGISQDCAKSEPSVYTRVAYYRHWIDEMIKNM